MMMKMRLVMRIVMMICKEEEEGSRVLEVIWLVMNLRVIMRIVMMICKEEEEGTSLSTRGWDFALLFRTLTIATFQSLLYRCPPGYLFSKVIVRCAKEEDVSCPLGVAPEADFR